MLPTIACVIGILSGLLTAETTHFLDPVNPFVAVVFGAGLTLLVWVRNKECSVWVFLCLIASSVASYSAAVWGTLSLVGFAGRIVGSENSLDLTSPYMFAIAGFLGALIINITLLLLLSPETGLRLLRRAAAWAGVGALLGFLASELSEHLGVAIATVLGNPPRGDMGHYTLGLYSAYLIWQTGIAFLIPFMLPYSAFFGAGQAVPLPRSPAKLSALGKLFFCTVYATVLLFGFFEAKDQYRRWDFQRESEKSLRETPSVDNLPVVASKPPEEALILHEIAGYVVTGGTVERSPAHVVQAGINGMRQNLAERIVYRAEYRKPQNTAGPTDQVKTTAIISEFPNTDWATFQLKNGPAYDNSGLFLYSTSTRTTKFGNSVLIHTMASGHDLFVYWPSSNKVVVIYSAGGQAEDIVKLYLAKYPSSL